MIVNTFGGVAGIVDSVEAALELARQASEQWLPGQSHHGRVVTSPELSWSNTKVEINGEPLRVTEVAYPTREEKT